MADGIIRRFVRIFFDRESAKTVEAEMSAALEGAGAKAGENTGKEFLRELRKEFNKQQADLRVALAKGIISPEEFRRQSDEAARAFNDGILKGIEQARKAGALTEHEYNKLARQLKRVGDEGDTAWSRIISGAKTALGVLAGVFAFDRISAFVVRAADEALKARLAFAQLEAANRSTGQAAGFTTEQLRRQAEALALVSRFSAEAIQGGLTRLLTYTEIQGDMFERASVAALDMAERLGIDVASAAEKVGNALNYPTKALNSLTRQGFRFTEQQQKQIAALEKSGDIAGAQAIILRELELAYGGAAKAANDALGPWGNLAKEASRMRQSFGEVILASIEGTGAIDALTRAFGALADNAGTLLQSMLSLAKIATAGTIAYGFTKIGSAVTKTVAAFRALRVAIAATYAALGPGGWVVLGVIAVASAFELASSRSRKAAEQFADDVQKIKDSLAGLNAAQLEAEAEASRARANALTQQLGDLKSRTPEVRFGRSGLPVAPSAREKKVLEDIAETQRQLNIELERGKEVARLRGIAMANALRGEADATNEVIIVDEERAKKQRSLFAERSATITQEIEDLRRLSEAVASGDPEAIRRVKEDLELEREIREAIRDLTGEQAAAIAALIERRREEQRQIEQMGQAEQNERERQEALERDAFDRTQREFEEQQMLEEQRARLEAIRQGVAVGAIEVQRTTNAELHAYNREMFIRNELMQMGIDANSAFGQSMAELIGQSYDAANQFASPWKDGLTLLREEVMGAGTLFGDLAQAWAQGGFKGIVALAKAKVKENLAAAIENGAKALGALALGQIGASKNFAAAAAQHGIAAARWGALAAAGGGGGGAQAAGGGGSTIANAGAGSSADRAGPEVHIYIDPLSPEDYRVQTVVRGALSQALERQGENATVRIHRRRSL